MKKSILIIFTLLVICFYSTGQNPTIDLTFQANNYGQHIKLNNILIENLTQGCDTTLYSPDTALSLESNVGIDEVAVANDKLYVSQNYPNPFTDQTKIDLYLPSRGLIEILVQDILGRELTYYTKTLNHGFHSFRFKAGMVNHYVLTVKSGNDVKTLNMVCLSSDQNSSCKLIYNGTIDESQIQKSSRSITKFGFSVGDLLKFTGYTNVGESIIHDNISINNTYTFQFEVGISAPSNLVATAVSSSQINLSWNDNSNNETGFKIERSLNGSSGWSEIFSTSVNITSYYDTDLSAVIEYYYRVRAFIGMESSNYSNIANATTWVIPSAPVLTGPTISTGTFTISITYNWGSLVSSQDYYELEESTTSATSGFNLIYTSPPGPQTSPYAIQLTRDEGTYYYRARAWRGVVPTGFTPYSNVVTVEIAEPTRSITLINNASSSMHLKNVVQMKIARFENGVYKYEDLLCNDPGECLYLPGDHIQPGESNNFEIPIGPIYYVFIGMGTWETFFALCGSATPWCKRRFFTTTGGDNVWVWKVIHVVGHQTGESNWTITGSYLNGTLVVTPEGNNPIPFNTTYYNPIP